MTKTLSKEKFFTNQKLILIVLAFFAVSIGLWDNFRQLWLSSNGLSAVEISKVMSFSSILAALYLIYYTNVVSVDKIKNGMIITFILKIITSISLVFLNNCGNLVLIKFCFFVDKAMDNILLSSIYPLMIAYQKSAELYGRKSVTEYTYKTVGVLIGSLLLGRVVAGCLIDYNVCLVISILFTVISFFVLLQVNNDGKKNISKSSRGVLHYLKKHKIAKLFFAHSLLANTTFYIGVGLKMLILTDYVGFDASKATFYILVISVFASILAKLSLGILKSKNDYVNVSIKFLVRQILFFLVFFTNHIWVLLIAISYILLTDSAYGHVINGFVYDKVEDQYTMSFTVFTYIFNLIGEAMGVFLAGVMYGYGFRYIYLLAALIMIVQLGFGYYLIYLKRRNS